MKAAVFFATKEGQTCRIAERIAEDLRHRGVDVDLGGAYGAVCVAASVHGGRHEREAI